MCPCPRGGRGNTVPAQGLHTFLGLHTILGLHNMKRRRTYVPARSAKRRRTRGAFSKIGKVAGAGYRFYNASNLGKAAMAAKLVYSAYRWNKARQIRKQKNRQFNLVDAPNPGSGTCKKAKNASTNFIDHNFDSRTLNLHEGILRIPLQRNIANGGEELNRRNRMLVNIRGIKICFHMVNISQKNITFHFAIVHNRRDDDEPQNADFYRNDGRHGDTRALAFGTYLSGMDHHCLNINTDKYVVIKHYKYMVGRNASIGTKYNEHMKNFLHFEKYLKLNKQIRFEDDVASGNYFPNIQILHWADTCDSPANQPPLANTYNLSLNTITYFREPKA